MRLNYVAIAPEATKALLRAGLDKRLMDLLFLRVSQINGSSYCVDEHAHDLRRPASPTNASTVWPDGETAPTLPRQRKLRLNGPNP